MTYVYYPFTFNNLFYPNFKLIYITYISQVIIIERLYKYYILGDVSIVCVSILYFKL
jgi:hypothetical protein